MSNPDVRMILKYFGDKLMTTSPASTMEDLDELKPSVEDMV